MNLSTKEREPVVPPPRKFGDWAFTRINPEAKFPGRKVDRLKTYQVKDTPVYDIEEKVWRYNMGRTSFTEQELVTPEEFEAWHQKRKPTPSAAGSLPPSTPTPSSSSRQTLGPQSAPSEDVQQKTPTAKTTLGIRKQTPTTNSKKKKTRRVLEPSDTSSSSLSSATSCTSSESESEEEKATESESEEEKATNKTLAQSVLKLSTKNAKLLAELQVLKGQVKDEKNTNKSLTWSVLKLNAKIAKLEADLKVARDKLSDACNEKTAFLREIGRLKKSAEEASLKLKQFDRETKILLEKEKRKSKV
jgi:hypothetical protein